jgi:catechol 2,3-dioxygenase-like lactoylglutathione lyase family enzyme
MSEILFAGVPVADFAAARAWYERLFGRPADVLPHETEAMWQVAEAGWIYVVGDAERAGRALVTVMVDDLDARLDAIADAGLPIGPVAAVGGGRKVEVTDPDGNRIGFAEVPRAD